MAVQRVVANIAAGNTDLARHFYGDILGLDVLMDLGWIVTYGCERSMTVQLSVMTEGGSGQPVPDISIEVDDLDEMLSRMTEGGYPIEYGPVQEPWGVTRFFVRDPLGKLVNVLAHA
ncbi:MAG: VOC family protein [Rhizobiaceae bacterium]|nr:VOC family protein [Rhizobiaceae bacterium]MCV0407608.1 VOC family protein [Rhizobiaceae bacterium]